MCQRDLLKFEPKVHASKQEDLQRRMHTTEDPTYVGHQEPHATRKCQVKCKILTEVLRADY